MATIIPFSGERQRRNPVPGTVNPPPAPCRSTPSVRALPSVGGRGGEYALADVARPLGLAHFDIRTIIEALRVEAQHNGMPLPKTPRHEKGRPITGPRAIMKKSRWDAGLFDAWLDTRNPGGTPAAMAPHPGASQATRDEMRRRAAGGH